VEIAGARVEPGTRAYVSLPVTRTLWGELTLPLHVVQGGEPGPVLTLLAGVHGDEIMPIHGLLEFLRGLSPSNLRGTVLAIPVANPPALATFRRETPEQREDTDLHRAFPGSPSGSLTQRIAWTLAEQVLARATHLVDFHSGGSMGRTQRRADLNQDAAGAVRQESLRLCRAFGCGLVHENLLPPATAAGHANARGIPAASVEIGGPYLPGAMTAAFTGVMLRGLHNVLRILGMEPGAPELPAEQWYFTRKERMEANPTVGGYLLSRRDAFEDLGCPVARGEPLGTVFDPYTLEVLEELAAPCDGILFFSRMSGLLEAGAKGFAIADRAGLTRLP
jgi:hypothetical protein